MNFISSITTLGKFASKFKTEGKIIAGLIFGSLSLYETVDAVRNGDRQINEAIKRSGNPSLTAKEKVSVLWRPYLKPVLFKVASDICLLGAISSHRKEVMGLTTACTIAESALAERVRKEVDLLGEKKKEEIDKAVAQSSIDLHPISNRMDIVYGKGDEIFHDLVTGAIFWCTRQRCENAIRYMNECGYSSDNGWVELNTFYHALQVPDCKFGEINGALIVNRFGEKCPFHVVYSVGTIPKLNLACTCINYDFTPEYQF